MGTTHHHPCGRRRRARVTRPAIVTLLCLYLVLPAGAQQSRPAGRQTSAPAATLPLRARLADYQRARQKARAWLDRLEVDAAELVAHDVKGIKKLAEILYAYLSLYEHTDDPAEKAKIFLRVTRLALQVSRDEYHAILTGSDEVFHENSMSYLRVLHLLEQFGLEMGAYRRRLAAIRPQMDAHLTKRGPWQRAMFADYYDRFGLEKPAILRDTPTASGILAQRKPLAAFTIEAAYRLTHEVYVAYDYGMRRKQDRLTPEDIAYLRQLVPGLLRWSIQADNPDLAAELLSCMTYLGWHDYPIYTQAIGFLLDSQNANGSWGDYERLRPRVGKYVDQHAYLHTTMTATRALLDAFEGDWPTAE